MSKCIAVLSALSLLFCGCSEISANSVTLNETGNTTESITKSITENVTEISETAYALYTYTVQDAVNLRNYLLNSSAEEDLKDKPYDLDNNGVWNVVDFCMIKHEILNPDSETTDTIVVYFSRTDNTEKIADYIIDHIDSDSYEIEAAIPYTSEDIEYTNSSCRANQEQNDRSVRPEIAGPIESLDQYDVIYLGYPIWWGEEPRIIDTFLESYDFSEKTVIPFCTSASSGIAASERNISTLVSIGNQIEGKRFSAGASKESVCEWVDSLNLSAKTEEKLYLTVNGKKFSASFENNSSALALKEKLSEGDIIIDAREYGGFEKVGSLGFSLPRNDTQYSTDFGDIMLYQGNQITLFYETNSWSYTKIGHVDNLTQEELKNILGNGDAAITLSLK